MSKSKKTRTLIKAAKMGKPYAMYQLGLSYESGKNVPLDTVSAAYWILSASEAGYIPAKEWIADYGYDDDAFVQANS